MNKPQIRERIEGMNAELAGTPAAPASLHDIPVGELAGRVVHSLIMCKGNINKWSMVIKALIIGLRPAAPVQFICDEDECSNVGKVISPLVCDCHGNARCHPAAPTTTIDMNDVSALIKDARKITEQRDQARALHDALISTMEEIRAELYRGDLAFNLDVSNARHWAEKAVQHAPDWSQS